MANQLKFKLAIIVVAIGIGLLPVGYLLNGYTIDQADVQTSEVLADIRDAVVPYIEENYMGVGIPDAIKGFQEEETEDIRINHVNYVYIPEVLQLIKNKTIAKFPEIINWTKTVEYIMLSIQIWGTFNSIDQQVAEKDFFNNITYISGIKGVSNYKGVELNYTDNAIMNILYYGIDLLDKTIPGFYGDLEFGSGIGYFLDAYNSTFDPIDGELINSTLQSEYEINWDQATSLNDYLLNHAMPNATSSISDIKDLAERSFYRQWANETWNPSIVYELVPELRSGLDLKIIFEDLDLDARLFEMGDDTELSLDIAEALWNPSNSSSFLNETGFAKWWGAYKGDTALKDDLIATFDLSGDQYDDILNWLFNRVKNNILPAIVQLPISYGMTTLELAELLFFEQWANSTLLSEPYEYKGITGFELGSESNISVASARALFNPFNSSSITNYIGMIEWSKAADDNDLTTRNNLGLKFSLNTEQVDIVCDWLNLTFRPIVPDLLDEFFERQMYYYANNEFLRQWSNLSIYTSGFSLDLVFPSTSFPAWEIGITTELGISQANARQLWNDNSEFALTNPKGIGKWFASMESSEYYDILSEEFELNSAQMDEIHSWLIDFRDNLALDFLELQIGFNLIEQANSLLIIVSMTSFAFIIVGVAMGIIFWMLEKRK